MSFPIDRASYRTLDPDWEGEVFVADIDRTYLATHFSSMKGLARIPFERAADKEDIAGMARLFREIRRGPGAQRRDTPLSFVSASPAQLRPVIERKMMLDGIGFDGTTFKNWSRIVRRMRLRRLKEQIGFKLTALLSGRAALPVGAIENLMGDDLETDPVAFAMYADILAGRLPVHDLLRILQLNGVYEGDARAIVRMRRELSPGRGVRRAYIRMERHADPEVFKEFGPGIVGCRGAFQMAAALMHEGSISIEGVIRVAEDLLQRGLPPQELLDRMRDLCRRALLTPDETSALAQRLSDSELLPALGDPGVPDPAWEEVWSRGPERLWTPPRFVGEG
ncbi:MAG: phosphatase domain-containing protein [Nannocystaceae bacterium]